jgi:2-polyprenyl-6-methoxyphenol hydroxylase-like FAD-dependent oxidoreductase
MSSPHFLSNKRICVSGAGVAGLAFAIGLLKQWPSDWPPPTLVIYERDTEEGAIGREGYSLSLRSDPPGGLQALQKLGLLDRIVEASVVVMDESGGASMCIWDRDLKELLRIRSRAPAGLPVAGTRIARNRLRSALVRGVQEAGCEVTWGVTCTGVTRDAGTGRLKLRLGDGRVDVCDLVVAADGGSSKIRSQLRPEDTLEFRRVCTLTGTSRFEGPPPEPVHRDYGMVLSGTGTGMFVSPVDARSALWSLSWHTDTPRESKKAPLSKEDVDALLAEARQHVAEFPPLFETLLDATDPSTLMLLNAMDKPPFRHTDAAFPDVVYIGDANHAVSPFAGNGANMALNDGWDMAQLLCGSQSLADAVKAYDTLVEPRSRRVWKQSHFNIALTHATGLKAWFYVLLMKLMAIVFF